MFCNLVFEFTAFQNKKYARLARLWKFSDSVFWQIKGVYGLWCTTVIRWWKINWKSALWAQMKKYFPNKRFLKEKECRLNFSFWFVKEKFRFLRTENRPFVIRERFWWFHCIIAGIGDSSSAARDRTDRWKLSAGSKGRKTLYHKCLYRSSRKLFAQLIPDLLFSGKGGCMGIGNRWINSYFSDALLLPELSGYQSSHQESRIISVFCCCNVRVFDGCEELPCL